MEVYFGGQIRKEFRGDLAAVVMRGKHFLGPISSKEFIRLTYRAGRESHLIERVYIGISSNVGDVISRIESTPGKSPTKLRDLDHLVVDAYFLSKKP